MALHLGSSQNLKINSASGTYNSNVILSISPIINKILLVSKDGNILKDSNGIYLTAKGDK